MKKLFTKTSFVAVMLFVLGATMSANAQTYPVTTLGTNVGATAVTKDAAGNVYVIEDAGSPESPSSAKTGQIVEYLAGTSTGIPLTGTNAIPYVDQYVANSFPFGIAIDGSGNIFVTTFNDFAGPTNILGNILKFTRGSLNGNGTYSYTVGSSPWVTGSGSAHSLEAFEGLVVDSQNNLFATAFDIDDNAYVLVEYPSGSSTPSVKYTHLGDGNVSGGSSGSETYSNPYVLAIDSHDNIYAATSWDESNTSDGGKIIELSKSGGYTTESNAIATSAYCVALGFDASNNLYAINGSSNLLGTLSLVEYAAVTGNTLPVPGVSTSGVTHYSNSNAHNSDNGVFGAQDGNFFPFGLAIPSDNVIFASAGTITTGSAEGDFVQFASTISSITATTPFLKSGTETFTATFGSAVSGVTASNFSTANPGGGISGASVGTPTTTDGGIIWSVPVNTGSGDGTLGLNLQNSTNLIPGISTTLPFTGGTATVDNTAPTIMISSPSQSSIIDGAGSVTYTVTYADANFSSSSLVLSNITLNKGSSANGTVGLTGSGTSYTVTISGITGSGTLGISIAANTAVDKAGNDAPASGASTTFTVLTPSITVPGGTTTLPSTPSGTPGSSTSFNISGSNLSPASGNLTVTAPANVQVSSDGSTWTSSSYTVAYSGSSLGSTAVHVRLSGTGTVGTISGNVSVSGGGATAVNQAVSGSLNSPSTTISSLTAVNSTLTNATSVQYTATFAASISGLAASNFSFVPGSIASASVTSVTEVSGTTWTVTVNTGSGDGTIQLELSNSGGISPSVSNTGFTGTTYTIDKTAPTVSIGAPSVSYINSSATVSYTVTWSDANLNTSSISLTPAQLQFGGSGYAVNLGNVIISGSGATRTISITGVTGNGSMSFSIPSGTASDNAGNSAAASNTSSTVVIDNTPPTVTIGPPSTTLTNTGPVTFDVSYSDANFASAALTSTNITLNASGASASVAVTPNSPTDYTVTLSGITGNGTLGISVQAGTSVDHAGNTDIGAGPSTLFTVDNIPPTVSSITATTPSNTNPTNSTTLAYTVTFSEAVTGVDQSAFTGNNLTGTVSYSSITVTPVSSSVYTVTLNGISGDGTMRLDMNSGTSIQDLAGNIISGGFTGDVYHIDNTPPTALTLIYKSNNANQLVAKIGDVITLDFTASEAIQSPLVKIAGHSVTAVNTTGNEWVGSYTMTSGDTEGRIPFLLSFFDLANNPQPGNGYTDIAAGDDIEFDMTAPTVTISAPSVAGVSNNGLTSVTYTVTYADANFNTSNLTNSGITLNTSGTATGTFNVTGAGTSYTVTISGISGIGALGISVGAGFSSDLAGNTDLGAGASAMFNVLSDDALLSNVAVSGVTLTPSFAGGTTSYTASVTNAINSITVTPTTDDPNATVTVNTATVTSGTASGAINLSIGQNTITTVVTAADGVTRNTYTVTVTRLKSSNDYLSYLQLSNGTLSPAFNYLTQSYTARVSNTTGTITVTPRAADATEAITVNGVTVASEAASGPINLAVGQNTITTIVTAQNVAATKTYTTTVTRLPALSALTVSSGTVIPPFASGITRYSAYVINPTNTIAVTPTTSDAHSTIKVNSTAVTSGTASSAFPLSVGQNTITIVVTSQDGTATQTYTLTVTRYISSNAALSYLQLSSGTLSPAFNYLTQSYTASVSNATGTITVTPRAADATQVITVDGVTVASETASGPINLTVGSNTITTIVTAQNVAATKTYTVTVTRAAPGDNNVYEPVSVVKPDQEVTLEDDGITVHQAVSPNGDGINDFLTIDNITNYPDNHLVIMNRNGMLVYEAKGYDNSSRIFDGHSNKTGQMQLPGTYFYSLDYTVKGIAKHKTGFIVLKY